MTSDNGMANRLAECRRRRRALIGKINGRTSTIQTMLYERDMYIKKLELVEADIQKMEPKRTRR